MSQASNDSLNHDDHCDCDDCDANTWECTRCADVYRLDLDAMRPISIWEVTYCSDCISAVYKHLGRTLCVMMYHATTDKNIADHLECEDHDSTFDTRIIATLLENNSWSVDDLKKRIADLKKPNKRKRAEKDATNAADDEDSYAERKKQRTK